MRAGCLEKQISDARLRKVLFLVLVTSSYNFANDILIFIMFIRRSRLKTPKRARNLSFSEIIILPNSLHKFFYHLKSFIHITPNNTHLITKYAVNLPPFSYLGFIRTNVRVGFNIIGLNNRFGVEQIV